jgi:hypothetical protein
MELRHLRCFVAVAEELFYHKILACRLKSAADFHPPFISMTFAIGSYSDFGRRARSGGLVAQENESGTIRRDPAGV